MKVSKFQSAKPVTIYDMTFNGTVERMDNPKTINTKHGNTLLCSAYILLDNGVYAKLDLWGEYANSIRNGNKIRITNGCITHFGDEKTISTVRKSTIEVIK